MNVGTYKITSGLATSPYFRKLNLYSSGSVSNGMNVVLYETDQSNEQKWYFDGERLYPETDSTHRYCLDRYTASTYLDNADKPCIVAIDEFQQIVRYEDETIEAIIRTYVQRCTNAHFIFSGSQRHLMNEMFTSPARPFYPSVIRKFPDIRYWTRAVHHEYRYR